MRLTVVEESALQGSVLSFAARRRGHTVTSLTQRRELFEALPFEPAAVAIVSDAPEEEVTDTVVRARERFPDSMVVLVTAAEGSSARQRFLRAGAHEVVPAAFDPFEVVLKTETWARNFHEDRGDEKRIRIADLEVDAERYSATKNGVALSMTGLELRILYCLCAHYPSMTPHERFLSFAWGSLHDPDPSLIRTHICHIRKKLQNAGGVPMKIRSKHTLGYELSVPGA